MCIKNLQLFLLSLFFIFSCSNKKVKKINAISERLAYYETTKEGPIALYCHVDAIIRDTLKISICNDIITKFNDNLSLNLIISRSDTTVDVTIINIMYFDAEDSVKSGAKYEQSLVRLFESERMRNSNLFQGLPKGDYGLRLQLEKLCHGFTKYSSTELSKISNKTIP